MEHVMYFNTHSPHYALLVHLRGVVCLSESQSLQYDTFINTSTQYRLTVLQTTKNDAEEIILGGGK